MLQIDTTSRQIDAVGLHQLASRAFDAKAFQTAIEHANAVRRLLAARDLRTKQARASSPKHSIIVVTHRHSDDFLDLIRSLIRYSTLPDFELVFVNNGNEHLEPILANLMVDCTIVDPQFNYGASGARNLGVHYARGSSIIFIDDDGLLEGDAIEALVECREAYAAVTARGRVVPKSNPLFTAEHYNKGNIVCSSVPDTEGICIWQKDAYTHFGGYDPLLYGHEGVMLACKMFRFYGPNAFLYTPKAVLVHDYVKSEDGLKNKTRRHEANRAYLDFSGYEWQNICRTITSGQRTRELQAGLLAIADNSILAQEDDSLPTISVITTAKNGSAFIEDYVSSLKRQTHRSFEVIFVDDHSDDDTPERVAELWGDDQRMRIFRSNEMGRANALNVALGHAVNDICVIADVDDISHPNRLLWTARYFRDNVGSTSLSFYSFDERQAVRLARPIPTQAVSIRARALVSMPVSFPAFAFRRSRFLQPFSPELSAGIDCEWIYRNLADSDGDGHLMPIPAVYYRTHDGQISATKTEIQREQNIDSLKMLHSKLGLEIDDEQTRQLAKLSGWTPIESGSDLAGVLNYVHRLSARLDRYAGCPRSDSRRHLHDAFLDLQERRLCQDNENLKKNISKVGAGSGSVRPALNTNVPVEQDRTRAVTNYGPLAFRRVFLPFGYAAVSYLGNHKDLKQFKANPSEFFINLRSPMYRRVGLFFFPARKTGGRSNGS